MEFLEKNVKGLLALSAVVIVGGLIATFVAQKSVSQEKQVQEKFFALDAKLKKYKEEKFKSANPAENNKSDQVNITVNVDQLKTELEQFINENTGTVASQMAALELSELLGSEKKEAEALALLQKAESNSDLLTNVMVRMKIAQFLADQDKCSEALVVWDKILKSKSTIYLHAEVKLNQALCYKKMNDLVKAEEILNQVRNDKSEQNGQAVSEADRILRLIQFNKSFGT